MKQHRMGTRAVSILLVWMLVCMGFIGMIIIFDEFVGEAEAITVPVDYPTIQDAINNSMDGDIIYVWAGKYYENIVVDKTVTLIGNGSANTTIDGSDVGDVVKVTVDWVNITGFTITNSGGEKGDSGIELDRVKYCNISDNDIIGNYYGVYLPPSCIITITSSDYNDDTPQINEKSEVVWKRTMGISGVIYFWNGSSEKPVYVNIQGSYEPQINDNGEVVWYGDEGFGFGEEIFFWNGGSTKQITNNVYEDWYPKINNNGEVVWQGNDGSDWEIYFWNGTGITSVTDTTYNDQYPQINDNGDVVWSGWDGNDWEIYFWNGTNTTNVTDNAYSDQYPQINDNGDVVWSGWDGIDDEIYFWNGTSTTNVTDNDISDYWPQINNDGKVVWIGWDGSDWEIFFWDGISTTQITNNTYDDAGPLINSNGEVVWEGWDGSDWEIFFWDGTSIIQITENAFNEQDPQINDKGEAVWTGFDGNDREIFFYFGPEATDNTISSNSILNNLEGIVLSTGSSDNTISQNDISVNSENGIHLDNSHNNPILNNNFSLNTGCGIFLNSSNNNNISDNNISLNNLDGINISYSSENNTISNNNISLNNNYGIYIKSSNNNLVFHNDFIDSGIQAYDDSTNEWNLTYPGGGNYWGDYSGWDFYSGANQDIPGSDAIGDHPYNIDGGANAKDYYPLLKPTDIPDGGIIISSHSDGDYVGGTIIIEAVTTFGDLLAINFYINGTFMFSDDISPYQYIFDTTIVPDGDSFEVKAEAVLLHSSPVNISITLIASNYVQTGDYITVSTMKPEYHPDEDVSVVINMNSPPTFDTLDLIVNYTSPTGNKVYTIEKSLPSDTQYTAILPLPSDAELGTYTITVHAFGFVKDSMIWSAENGTTFLVSGKSLRDQLEELNQTLTGLNLTELIATLDQLNQTLSSMDLTELLDAIEYLNQTLPVKIYNLSLQLSGVNDSLQSGISDAEINLLNELANVNATLANDIQNILASITNDIIGMNSSLSDQLTNLLNTMTTDSDALRTWLDIVLGAIDTNLTDTRAVLEAQLGDLEDYMTGFNDSLQSDLGGIIADIQAHDSNTGQNHSDIIDMLGSLQGDIGEIDIDDLKTMLTSLTGNVSAFDQSIAADIQKVVDDITEFETGTTQRLGNISTTIDDLARWEDVLSKLEELDSNLDTAENELSASIDKIPTEKEKGFGVTEGLLIIVLILLILILLVMLTGRRRQGSGAEEIPKERVEPKTMELEEKEWEGEEEPEEEELEEIEEIEFEE